MEPLTKDLLTGHFTARLDGDGTLTIVEEYTSYNALEEPVNSFTELVMPAQATRALLNFLHHPASRARIGARQQKEGKHATTHKTRRLGNLHRLIRRWLRQARRS